MAQIAIMAVMAVMALNEGAQKRKVKYQEGQALTEAGHRQLAATSAEVAEAAKTKERVEGRAISVAAASGAGVDDPTMVNLISDLNTEGEYRMMAKLYVGSTEAEGMYHEAEMARRAGEAELDAAYVKVAKTVMSSYGNFGAMGKEAAGTFAKIGSSVKGMFRKGGSVSTASSSLQRPTGLEFERWGY